MLPDLYQADYYMKEIKYLLFFICFIPLLIFRDFTPNNELKYLSIADEALRNGHFFTFWNHGAVYADKPPLYLWIVMLGKWLLGTHSMFFLGLFSLVPALVTIYVMDKWVKGALLPAYRSGAALMLITSGLFTGAAIVLRMDMLMCMFIVLALYTFFRQYQGQGRKYDPLLLPVYIFLAVFTKGPVGLLVPLLSIPAFLVARGKLREFPKYLGWKQSGILVGLCAVWFAGVYLEGGKAYLNNLLFNQTVNRAIDSFHHKEPVWYYLKTIWYSLAPWVLFYLVAIIVGIRAYLLNTDLKRFFMTVIVTTFIALSVFSGKLDIYMLPVFPFIAYLAFLMLPDISEKYVRFTIAIPAILLCLAFPGYFIALKHIPFPFTKTPVFPVATAILTVASVISLYFLFRRQFLRSTNSLAIGLLLAILTGSLAIPGLNEYIGFGKICRKAQTLAHQEGIKDYYFYPFRSAENMDAYLQQEINPLDVAGISSLIGKQKFILFVRNKDVIRNPDLHEIVKVQKSYPVGDKIIIVFY